MKVLFWTSIFLTAYAYIGYAVWLFVYSRIHKEPVLSSDVTFDVSIIIAARNEESNLPAKLDNLRRLNYPREHLQIIVASDGSTDRTVSILEQHSDEIEPLVLEHSQGKASALNQAVARATGDILVFLDARQSVDPDAISELVACFADPSIGAVSGELLLESSTANGLGLYWKIEKIVRKLESRSGSVIGVTGAIYAIRRELFRTIPKGTLLDDVYVPMQVARVGKRIVFQSRAIARDKVFSARGKEFARKVRTLTGNYQLLQLEPWLLSMKNPLLFRFVSHKLMRLLVPFFLLAMLVASAFITTPFYRAIFWMQIVFYGLAILGNLNPKVQKWKPVAIAHTFTMLNAAATVAFYNFITRREGAWG